MSNQQSKFKSIEEEDCEAIADTVPYYSLDGNRPLYTMQEVSAQPNAKMRYVKSRPAFQRQSAAYDARIDVLYKQIDEMHHCIVRLREIVCEFTDALERQALTAASDRCALSNIRQRKIEIVQKACELLFRFHDELEATNRTLWQEEHDRALLREAYALAGQADVLLLQAVSSGVVHAINLRARQSDLATPGLVNSGKLSDD